MIRALDLDADFPAIERLFEHEQWPFLRSDLEKWVLTRRVERRGRPAVRRTP